MEELKDIVNTFVRSKQTPNEEVKEKPKWPDVKIQSAAQQQAKLKAHAESKQNMDELLADLDNLMAKNVKSLFNVTAAASVRKGSTSATGSSPNQNSSYDTQKSSSIAQPPVSNFTYNTGGFDFDLTQWSTPQPTQQPQPTAHFSKPALDIQKPTTPHATSPDPQSPLTPSTTKADHKGSVQVSPQCRPTLAVTVVNIYTESKSFFSSYRVFTLKTEPGQHIVKRNRTDLKWLCDKMQEEFPGIVIPQIDKGELSKSIVEQFFESLINKLGLSNSRYLNYFLCTEDKKFEDRKTAEDGAVAGLFQKLLRPSLNPDDLNISSTEKTKVGSTLII